MVVNGIFLVVYNNQVLFWGTEDDIDEFIVEHPWYDSVCEVLTWQEYLSK